MTEQLSAIDEQKIQNKLTVVSYLIQKQTIEIFMQNLKGTDPEGLVLQKAPVLKRALELLEQATEDINNLIIELSEQD